MLVTVRVTGVHCWEVTGLQTSASNSLLAVEHTSLVSVWHSVLLLPALHSCLHTSVHSSSSPHTCSSTSTWFLTVRH